MELGLTSYGLAWLAGLLSTLSPCVLPLLPILVGTAASSHRYGPFALVCGLMLSFTLIGVSIGSLGTAIGLETTTLRAIGSLLLILFGITLLSDTLQARFASLISRVGSGKTWLASFNLGGLHGQFVLGMLLGVVWTPCVGPTLGVAITLASQGQVLWQVAAVMLMFSLGAALPLLAIGLLSRQALSRWRNRMMQAGQAGKKGLGMVLLLMGMLIFSGADKALEQWALDNMPDWLTTLTTRI
jgi:cytochrome c biogenesis protein CcdA